MSDIYSNRFSYLFQKYVSFYPLWSNAGPKNAHWSTNIKLEWVTLNRVKKSRFIPTAKSVTVHIIHMVSETIYYPRYLAFHSTFNWCTLHCTGLTWNLSIPRPIFRVQGKKFSMRKEKSYVWLSGTHVPTNQPDLNNKLAFACIYITNLSSFNTCGMQDECFVFIFIFRSISKVCLLLSPLTES